MRKNQQQPERPSRDSSEPKIEDILIKDIRVSSLMNVPDASVPGVEALSKFTFTVSTVDTPKLTTDVLAAWSNLSDGEQAQLEELLSRRQIAQIGLAIANNKRLRHERSTNPIDRLRRLLGHEPEGGDE